MNILLAAAAGLIGVWQYAPALRDARSPVEPCGSDHGIRYEPDGRFTTLTGDASGTWRTEGRWLIERVTHEADEATGRDRKVRNPQTRTRLQWLSSDRVNLIMAPGKVQGMIRCPGAR